MTRYVIALDSNPYDDDSDTVDIAIVTADDYDSEVTDVEEPESGESQVGLIKSYLDEGPLTPRQIVGLFGLKGMYRQLV